MKKTMSKTRKTILCIILSVITLLALSIGLIGLNKPTNYTYAEENATFKAVFDETDSDNKTLTFYYDKVDHSGTDKTVYDNLRTDATMFLNWGYNGIRGEVKSVIFDESIKDFHGLTSTAFMLYDMKKAESITGVEYLDVSNVTIMTSMFQNFGNDVETFNVVPDVSEWNTAKVRDMTYMFQNYGFSSTELTAVPNVENWNMAQVANMSSMFYSFGFNSQNLNFTLDLTSWNLSNVSNCDNIFARAGVKTLNWNVIIPDTSSGKTNTTAEWYVGNGSSYISPAINKSFTLVPVRTITNATPKADKDQNNGYITVKGQSGVGSSVKVQIFANEGYALSTLVYNDGVDHDITESKSFIMGGNDVTVTATFGVPSFKAVFDENGEKNTLTFYYDAVDYSGEKKTVYDNLRLDATMFFNWDYNGIRGEVKSVIFDESIKDFHGLTSTAYMLYNMTIAEDIKGVEFLDVSNVTIMNNMFANFGYDVKTFNVVPDVSEWDTANVKIINHMFTQYGLKSTSLEAVPNVEKWNMSNVISIDSMFESYGGISNALDFTLNLSGWNLDKVTGCINMFKNAGASATKWEVIIPDISSGKTNTDSTWYVGDGTKVITPAEDKKFTVTSFKAVYDENGEKNTLTFYYDAVDYSGEKITVFDNLRTDATYPQDWGYDEKRESVKAVIFDKSIENLHNLTSTSYMLYNMKKAENITGAEYLDVSKVTKMDSMFYLYGNDSTTLNVVPDVENWDTALVTTLNSVFSFYGYNSTVLNNVPNVENWDTSSVKLMSNVFNSYGYNSTVLNVVPNVENWNTSSVTDMNCTFQSYGSSSTELNAVPNVENWDTALVESVRSMFVRFGYDSEKLDFTLDLSGWDLSKVVDHRTMFNNAGKNALNWQVIIPDTSSGKTNTTAEWHVGSDGSLVISPASDRKFTLVRCYTIFNGMPEANKEQNNGYIAVKEQSPQGKTVKVEVFANVGYVLNCLFYQDGIEHDITDSKSFIMPKTQVAVRAVFALCTDHVDSDENGICDKCGGEYVPCVHENTEVIYDLIDDNANCIAKLVCTDCQEILLSETVATEIIEDTKATCTEKAKGHYKATFINTALGVKETDTNSVEYGVPLGHNFINYVCERCNVEDLSGAKTDSISAINTLIDGRTDTALLLLVDTAKSQIESESVTTLTKIFEIRDCWLATFENLLEIIHEHTYSAEWSYNGTHHWHDNLCDDCTVVSDFGVHTFDSGVKIGNKTTFTCTCCGYSYSENDPFINTESAVIFETIKFKGYSLLLSSDISVNFYIELTEEQAENGVMEFTIGDRVITVNASYNANGYYFRCPLNTLEMATIVKAKFTYMNASVLKEYSVMDYINTVINGEYDAKLQALCKALATYGYYAQIELASIHDGVTIGDDGYTEVDYHNDLNLASAKSGLQYFGFVDDKKNSNIIGVGRSLSLDDKVAMNIYVQVKDGYTLTENMISVSDGKEFILVQVETNQYRITVLDIEATNLGTEYTITIDGESITTSALSYANKVVNGTFSASSQNAMTALYEYYLSATEYVKPIPTYTVTFNVGDHGDPIDPVVVGQGDKVIKPTNPTADGWEFYGWYKDEGLQNSWDFDNDTVTEDITLYAKWFSLTVKGLARKEIDTKVTTAITTISDLEWLPEDYKIMYTHQMESILSDAYDEIDVATTEDAINTIVEYTESKIDTFLGTVQFVSQKEESVYRGNAVEEVGNYATEKIEVIEGLTGLKSTDVDNYKGEINSIYYSTYEDIYNATSKADVDKAVADAKSAIDSVVDTAWTGYFPHYDTLDEYSWADLKTVSTAISKGTISEEEMTHFEGFAQSAETKKIELNTEDDDYLYVRIIGFNHDNLADGSGKAGITFMAVNSINKGYYSGNYASSSSTYADGWALSPLRDKMQKGGEIYVLLPSDLTSQIVKVSKISHKGWTSTTSYDSTLQESNDALFLLSGNEIGINYYGNDEGTIYQYIDCMPSFFDSNWKEDSGLLFSNLNYVGYEFIKNFDDSLGIIDLMWSIVFGQGKVVDCDKPSYIFLRSVDETFYKGNGGFSFKGNPSNVYVDQSACIAPCFCI